jgi:thiamine pyrophosphate-dependent acetolactate synthase large subunit-like protein
VKDSLRELLPRVVLRSDRVFLDSVRGLKVKCDHHNLGQSSFKDKPIAPHRIARMIGEIASDDSIFAIDVGESTVWAARYLKTRGRQRLIGSFNHGSMGCGLPLALGASSLNPSREVWAFCGDGAFVMSMADLITAVRFQWPVKIIVFNNSELGFVKMENEVSGNPLNEAATGLLNPQFAELARACGVHGIKLDRPEQLEQALLEAKNCTGPVLVEAMVSSGELTLPPHIDFKQAFGFGVSKLKEGLLGLEGDHEQWENWKEEFRASKHWLS